MCSHGDLVLHSIRNISPQNTLLPCTNLWFSLFSSLLAPSKIFDSFLLLESIWGAITSPVEAFDSAWTMQRPAENFINQEQRGECSRIWLCSGRRTRRSHHLTGWYNRAADRSFHMRANVCDPTKTIVKRSLKTLNCSVVFRHSVKGNQRAGFLIIEYICSYMS